MKKSLIALLPLMACAVAPSCSTSEKTAPEVEVHWQAVNLTPDSTGVQNYLQTYTVIGDLRGVERLCFNHFERPMQLTDAADTLIEIVPSYYAIGSPRFANATGNDTIVFEILTRGAINSICYAPDGLHLLYNDGTTKAAKYLPEDITISKDRYATVNRDLMPYGDAVYAINEAIAPAAPAGPYDVVPSFKSVELTGGESTVNPSEIEFSAPAAVTAHDEEYTITIADNKIAVVAPEKMWAQLGHRLKHLYGTEPVTLPNAKITDWPAYAYRGIMIDIARNFQTPAEMRRVVDMMADYGFNTLHFHAMDDEAWRIEIQSLPELTEVGARRGYTKPGETGFLPQIYAGDGNPETKTGSSNGYFTRAEYIDFVRYADSLGIAVIPEIESPGHARAAIKAMEERARRTGDNSILIREPNDSSVFSSAQAFRDNVMSPALDATYDFMSTVADELIAMHKEAGAPLKAIHIGGDEVAHGAWSGTPGVQELMAKEGLKSEKEVHAYFVNRLRKIYDEKGIKISGWQEIALRHSDEYNKQVVPSVYSINCWSTLGPQKVIVDEIAAAGYPIILSNVEHFYFDMIYSHHPEERGLSWGVPVDEFVALHGYPAKLCTVKGANVVGLQGQLWSETFRGPENLETMLLPKMLGLAERAWTPDSTYTDNAFHAVILNEIPKWEAQGYTYHVRQPGIKLGENKTFTVNSPYPDAVLRYTLDGTTPSETSPVIETGAFLPYGDASQIRVKLWLNGHPSPVSILYID